MRKHISLIVLFLAAYSLVYSQNQLKFEHISLKQGLSQSSVKCIYQDSKGFMWFGTLDGLNKYDGYKITVFRNNPDDSTSIPDNNINAIFEDASQRLWLGITKTGLVRYNKIKNQFILYEHEPKNPNSLSDNTVTSICGQNDSTLWVGTSNGLNRLMISKNGNIRYTRFYHRKNNSNTLSSNRIKKVICDGNQNIWLATNKGVNRLSISESTHTTIKSYQVTHIGKKDGLQSDKISDIEIGDDGVIWVGSNQGLDRIIPNDSGFSVETGQNKGKDIRLSDNTITALTIDNNGILWIGTEDGGLNALNTANYELSVYKNIPTDPNSLSVNHILALFIGKNNMLWVGTSLGGVDKWNRASEKFRIYRNNPYNPKSISANQIRVIYEDSQSNIWIGTVEGGLNKWLRDENMFVSYKHETDNPNSLSNNHVRAIVEDKNGIFWLGTHGGGLNRFDSRTGKFTHYRYDENNPKSINDDEIWSILIDHKGRFWIGTENGGVNLFDRQSETFTAFLSNPYDKRTISDNKVTAITEDSKQRIWFGTYDGGMNQLIENDNNKNRAYRFKRIDCEHHQIENPNQYRVYSIIEDSDNNIWVGTRGHLCRFQEKKNSLKGFEFKSLGLPNHVIMGILEDDSRYLWISTNAGIAKLDKKNMETVQSYTAEDGLQNNEFMIGAFCKTEDGEMLFGGQNGLNAFYPENITQNPNPPQIVITGFSNVNKDFSLDSSISEKNVLRLEHFENTFTFEFVAINYLFSEKNKYAYRLEGFEKEWNYVNDRRFASYTKLPHGKYVFHVKAANNDGVWNQEGVSLPVIIESPFWKTKWFIGIMAVVVVAVVFSAIRLRDVIRDRNHLEKIVQERTAEILQQNEEIKAQRDQIKNQCSIAEQRSAKIMLQNEEIATQRDQIEAQKDKIERAYKDIKLLSEFGKEITGTLSVKKIVDVVYNNVNKFMDATAFGIGIYNEKDKRIDFFGAKEYGKSLPHFYYSLIKKQNLASLCFLEKREILINHYEKQRSDYVPQAKYIEGKDSQSIVYVPLVKKDKAIGVITVQSFKSNVYTNYHVSVLKNLAVYVSIAIDNAEAYSQIENQKEKITAQRDMIEGQRDKYRKLNAMKDKFFSIVAHDLKNPFNSLLNISQLLIEQFDSFGQNQVKNFVESIHQSSKEAYTLLENLLNWARSQTNRIEIKTEVIDLKEIGDKTIALLQNAAADKDIHLYSKIPEKTYAKADINTIQTVIRNLISNAVKFTPPGGEIYIETKKNEEAVTVSICDTGVGIGEEERNKLFRIDVTHSTTGTSNEKGTGLGLILCKEFVEKNKGKIWVDSTIGKGSSFRFTLPLVSESDEKQLPLQPSKKSDNEPITSNSDKLKRTKKAAAGKYDFIRAMDKNLVAQVNKKTQTELTGLYHSAMKHNSINEIKDFGKKIENIGEEFSIKYFIEFGNTIVTQATNFDIVNVTNTLAEFPQMLEILQDAAEK